MPPRETASSVTTKLYYNRLRRCQLFVAADVADVGDVAANDRQRTRVGVCRQG